MASGATIGSAVIKLSFDGKDVNAELKGIGKELESSGKDGGSKFGSAWTVAAGNLISKGFSKISGAISNAMNGAISRVDTLNNFPKVMQSLGYSADESSSSVDRISSALDGLPTSLDGAIADVQKLAASMGNLNTGTVNATSVGLGLNDMLLAGGKGTAIASAAMEQYNQMLSRGKVDMQAWGSMVNAAPGQMNQLAQSLLGAEANQADLYKAMQEGTVTFDQFNAAVVQLDQEGGQGFSSFYDQAVAATGGIQTQLTNVSNTMNKIVGAALEGNLDDIGKYTEQLGDRIGAVAPTLIQGFTGAFGALAGALGPMVVKLLPSVISGVQSLINGVVTALPTLFQSIVQAVPMLISGVQQIIVQIATMLTQPQFLQMILQSGIQLLLELVNAVPQALTVLANALPEIINNIVAFLTSPSSIQMILQGAVQLFMALVMAVPQILGSLISAFGSLVGSLWNWITSTFQGFAANFGGIISGAFRGAVNGVLGFIEGFVNAPINVINGFVDAINSAFGAIGVNIGHIPTVSLPRLARGGVVDGATAAIIGEAGQEAVLPLENNTDNWAGLLASTLAIEMEEQGNGKEINVYMTNNINSELDAAEIGRVMIQSIRRAA